MSGVVKPGNNGNPTTDVASGFGIKLRPIDKGFTEAMQRNDNFTRNRALGTALSSQGRQMNSHEITQEEFDAAKKVLKAKRQLIIREKSVRTPGIWIGTYANRLVF